MPGRRRRPERRLLEISVLKQSPCEKRSLQGAVREVEAAFLKKGMFSCLEKKKRRLQVQSMTLCTGLSFLCRGVKKKRKAHLRCDVTLVGE